VHLSEEALDFVGAAAASPEVEVEPHLPPETNTRFHQGLHSIKLATLRRLWAHACHSAKRRAAGTSNRTTENARFKCEKQASSYLVPGIVVAERMLDTPHEQGVTLSVSNTNGGTLIDKLCVQWHA